MSLPSYLAPAFESDQENLENIGVILQLRDKMERLAFSIRRTLCRNQLRLGESSIHSLKLRDNGIETLVRAMEHAMAGIPSPSEIISPYNNQPRLGLRRRTFILRQIEIVYCMLKKIREQLDSVSICGDENYNVT